MSRSVRGTCCVYMVECKRGTYYAGWTKDLPKRIAAHNAGKGAKYLRGRGPVKLIFKKSCANVQEAMRLESSIKKLTREEKKALVQYHE